MRATLGTIIAIVSAFAATPALGVTAAQKCQAGKLKIAGKYDFCRLKAEAKAAQTGDPADYSKCDAKFAEKWSSTEADGGGMCPSNADEADIGAFITQHTDDLAAALAGGPLPDCPADLTECDADLVTCNADLTICANDLTTCQAGGDYRPQKTGQTGCWDEDGVSIACAGTGQDGEYQYGRPMEPTPIFTDNGDGTITDSTTGLMWEKISNDGSIHDHDLAYEWSDAFTVKISGLNGMAFAGHSDWRLPNINELVSLYSLDATVNFQAGGYKTGFVTSCPALCTVLTCNCGDRVRFWSSTSYEPAPNEAWLFLYSNGITNQDKGRAVKTYVIPQLNRVRAVRGGS